MPQSANYTDGWRCSYCGRLLRYYGVRQSFRHYWKYLKFCSICTRWCRRNRLYQQRDACCKHFRLAVPVAALPQVWKQIVSLLVGSDHEDEMKVQAIIWNEVLLGILGETTEDLISLDVPWSQRMYNGIWGPCLSWNPPRYFWTLSTLAPRGGGKGKNARRPRRIAVLDIVISFLGPFQPWQVIHNWDFC